MDIISIMRGLSVAAVPIVLAITLHEYAHGWAANKLGDPTAKSQGRLTLNPIAHIDPVGTIIVPIAIFIMSSGQFMFGSAKPVPVNFNNLQNPKRDMALVAVAGPAANIIISMASLLVLQILSKIFLGGDSTLSKSTTMILNPIFMMLEYSFRFNVFLAAFNLIPIPPLDGGRIAVSLLPARQAYEYSKLEPYGFFIVLILWALGLAKYIIAPIQQLILFIINVFFVIIGRIF